VQARDAIRTAGRALVVEGYMDVVALAQFGVGYAVATLGTATTPVHVSRLLRLADEIVFCFDGDKAGRKAAWRALEVGLPLALDHKPLRFLFLPDGEDPDTYVRKHGRESFEQLAREAQTLSVFLIGELRSQFNLATAEGRSGFLSAARPHVQKIAAPALRLQVVKEVAELARVTQAEAERLLEVKSTAPAYSRPAPPRPTSMDSRSQERNLLHCVIARPALATAIDATLLDEGQPETAALRRLAEWVEADGISSEALLIERFQGTEHEALVFQAQASVLEQGMPAESAEPHFVQIQLALRIRRKHEEFEALKREAGSSPSREQLALLDSKTKELAKLKSMRI
jgi:DNA primase